MSPSIPAPAKRGAPLAHPYDQVKPRRPISILIDEETKKACSRRMGTIRTNVSQYKARHDVPLATRLVQRSADGCRAKMEVHWDTGATT